MIYLDYNSTTPVDTRVLDVMLPYFSEKFGNAASKTHIFGWVAEAAVEKAREQIAKLIHATPSEIIFTSGATEAINLAIKGVWEWYATGQVRNHIITVSTEHKAVLDTCKALEQKGAQITYLPVNREGMIDLQQLSESITEKTILVSVMHANNETGVIHPVKEIARIVHEKSSHFFECGQGGCIFMSDATQSAGKILVDIENDGIDLLCLSAHKIYGPKGAGALFVRRKNPRVSLLPQIYGGGHERGLRSGTLNVPAIAGFGKACEIAEKEMSNDAEHISVLRDEFEKKLLAIGNVFVNGTSRVQHRLPNVTNLSFHGIKADTLISKLPGIAVSTGSACTSAVPEPSHVLSAMGLSVQTAYSSIRFSLGRFTTKEEIKIVSEKVKSEVRIQRLKQH